MKGFRLAQSPQKQNQAWENQPRAHAASRNAQYNYSLFMVLFNTDDVQVANRST